MLAPEVEGRPWAEQLALDDESYRAQLAYLFERSAFYREKLAAAGLRVGRSGGRPGGDRAAAPDREARAQGDVHPRQPNRRAPLRDSVRDRPDLLDERHDRNAELHPADGGRSRQLGDGLGAQLRGLRRHRGPTRRFLVQRRPVRRGRSDRGLRPHRPLPHPVGHRQYRPPADGRRPAQAGGRDPHPVLCRLPDRAGRRSGRRSAGSSVERVLVAGEPGGGSRRSAPSSKRAGARR